MDIRRISFESKRTDEDVLAELFRDKNSVILKYLHDGRIIGCVYLQKKEAQIYLGLLSVLPDVQASGVRKQLLVAAEEYAHEQNCSKIVMTVITSSRACYMV